MSKPGQVEDVAARRDLWPRLYLGAAASLLVWLAIWIVVSWPYSLDDALIHLRYAEHLLRQHRITYDGVHDSFGTSSLLYVTLLAGLRLVFTSPLLPRVVSSVVYVVFFAALARTLFSLGTSHDARSPTLWLASVLLLAITVAPSAVRWMDDGMETGLVFLDALLGFLLLRRMVQPGMRVRTAAWAAFAFGLLTVFLRVELLLLVVCISGTAALELWTRCKRRGVVEHPGQATWLAGIPILGGGVAALVIRLTMHSLLPDTALAKAFGAGAWEDTFLMTGITVVSSFSFGLGLLLIWLASLAGVVLQRRLRPADLPPNLLFPILLLASAARGQQIQGIRYFGWSLLFPTLWNLARWAHRDDRARRGMEVLRAGMALLLLALLPAFAWESGVFHRIFAERGATLDAFRAQPELQHLQGKLGIAEDVGFVGYFTQGEICDPYGLVNGRAAARLTYPERFDRCMGRDPVFAFGSRTFLDRVNSARSMAGWWICGQYRFDNVRSEDVHYLAVAPGEEKQACPATAVPIRNALPGLV